MAQYDIQQVIEQELTIFSMSVRMSLSKLSCVSEQHILSYLGSGNQICILSDTDGVKVSFSQHIDPMRKQVLGEQESIDEPNPLHKRVLTVLPTCS